LTAIGSQAVDCFIKIKGNEKGIGFVRCPKDSILVISGKESGTAVEDGISVMKLMSPGAVACGDTSTA